MNFADQLMALTRNRDPISNRYRDFYHKSNMSIDSGSSFSDEDDSSGHDNVFVDKNKNYNSSESAKLNRELATIFAANRLLSVDERDTSRPKKKNIYVQQRVKHHSGGSANGSKKMATAWKKFSEKFSKPQHKNEKHPQPNTDFDAWRRYSLDAPIANGTENGHEKTEKNEKRPSLQPQPLKHSDLRRLLSLDREEERPKEHRPMRPRSNSEVSVSQFVNFLNL